MELNMKRFLHLLATVSATALLAACGGGGGGDPAPSTPPPAAQGDLNDALSKSGNTNTMATAVDKAGLGDLIKGNQQYTLLMPNDAAMTPFAEDLAELSKPENKEALADYVKAHMVDGTLLAEQLQAAAIAPDDDMPAAGKAGEGAQKVTITIKNLLGDTLTIVLDNGVLTINGVAIGSANIVVRNGVLHILTGPIFRPSVFTTIKRLPQTSTLEAAIRAAGLEETLRDRKSDFTVLAPTNEAFEKLLKDLNLTAEQLLANKPLLTQVLTYHVIAGESVLSRQFKDGESIATVNGQRVIIKSTRTPGKPRMIEVTDATGGVSKVTLADLKSRNGVVHLIDRVLLPTDKDIVQVAQGVNDFSILVEAVVAAGLVDTLKGKGPFTVFAPTNAAFAALLGELNVTKEALLANKPLLTSVLTYHVLPKAVFADELSDGLKATTVQGQEIAFSIKEGKASITDASGRTSNIVAVNVQATNGVVHVIDKVILPKPDAPAPSDIVAIASANPDFSILVEAVVAAGLVDTLKGTGPFTVFAPTNAAFAALLDELKITKDALLANKPLLTSVLTYHVLSGKVLANQLSNGLAAATVQGQPIRFALAGGKASIVDARGRSANIVATDVLASNGVIHVLDKVILPTDKNIVQVAQGNPSFSILVEAVVAAGLVETLSGAGPFTVFAPTNDAFAALLQELHLTKAQLLANKPLLTKVLTYHVVSGQVLSSQIPFDQPIKSVEGQTFKIGKDLKITDQAGRKSGIVATDVAATNGVVHVIDKVILPKL
jgi:transforming growth factor-beta-induced protein